MKINSKYFIAGKDKTSKIITNLINDRSTEYQTGDPYYANLKRIISVCRRTSLSIDEKNNALTTLYQILGISNDDIASRLFNDAEANVANAFENVNETDAQVKERQLAAKKALAKDIATKVIDFFSEFNFSPSYRFMNSICRATNKRAYVNNYFMVQDHVRAAEIAEKTKSDEFKTIVTMLKDFTPENIINNRFELFFGEPGAGKTVKATSLTDSVTVCSSDMLPSDLMQNFVFKDGKADFDKSDLWIAMEEGKTITLDEVNMLPFESLRFLQGITDGKESFNYKGHEIKIHPNFKIYATMNLNVNGQCIPLPAPLVDRAYDIVEFKLTADALVSAMV